MADTLADYDKKVMRDRIQFIDAALLAISNETLKLKRDVQLSALREALAQLAAVSPFIDGTVNVDETYESWKTASKEDRSIPEYTSEPSLERFSIHHVCERILRRGIGLVRALPDYKAHKPMFPPYIEEIISYMSRRADISVQQTMRDLFDAMVG